MNYPCRENVYTYCGMYVCLFFVLCFVWYLVYTLFLGVKGHLYISVFFFTLSHKMNILIMYCRSPSGNTGCPETLFTQVVKYLCVLVLLALNYFYLLQLASVKTEDKKVL